MTLLTGNQVLDFEAPREEERAPSAWKYFYGVFSTTLSVVVGIIAALSVVVALGTHQTANNEYEAFGHPVMSVLSGSMSPTIQTGDLVVDNAVTSNQANHLRIGQIISFRIGANSPEIITHRIIGIEHFGTQVFYITKGDANNAADASPRAATNVVGVFNSKLPRGGYILSALHRPLVLILFLASCLLFFVAGPLLRRGRDMDSRSQLDSAPSTEQ